MPPEMTPEEIAFFESGDASKLIAAEAAPATPEPAAAPAPQAPAAAPAANQTQVIDTSVLLSQQQKLEQELTALREQIAKQSEPPPDHGPDPETDPLGALMHSIAEIKKEVAALHANQNQTTQQTAQQQQFDALVSEIKQVRADYMKDHPDFMDAYKHLRSARAQDLRDVGVPEKNIEQALLQDEIAVALNARAQGKNSADVIYNMAKRYGYQSTKAPAAPPADPAARVAALAKGVDAATGLPRAAATTDLTLEGLKDASEGDLNKLVTDEKAWARLLGGGEDDIFLR